MGLFRKKIENQEEKSSKVVISSEQMREWEDKKPDFEIVGFEDLHPFEIEKKCDINVLIAHVEGYDADNKQFAYDKDLRNPEKAVCIIYKLKNVGQTKIEKLILALNSCKIHSLFSIYDTIPGGINFTVEFNQPIEPQETITVQVCYLKDYIPKEGPILSFYMVDSNKNWWEQPFCPPENDIGITSFTREERVLADTDSEKLIDLYYIKPLTYHTRRM